MVHRAVLGSLERFVGGLIEHYAGVFPLWLAPVQAIVLPISDRHQAKADEILHKLKELGIRVELDARSETIGYRIREAQLAQIPYMLVIGDKEAESGCLSVRQRREPHDLGQLTHDQLIEKLQDEIKSKQT
jgi:threonyl-tRNA synthetase